MKAFRLWLPATSGSWCSTAPRHEGGTGPRAPNLVLYKFSFIPPQSFETTGRFPHDARRPRWEVFYNELFEITAERKFFFPARVLLNISRCFNETRRLRDSLEFLMCVSLRDGEIKLRKKKDSAEAMGCDELVRLDREGSLRRGPARDCGCAG